MKHITRHILAFAALAALLAVSAPPLHAADESPPASAASVVVVADSTAPADLATTANEPALYQAVAAETAASLTWQQSLIVVFTPIIIAGLKKIVPEIPKVWLPILAAVLGGLGGWVTSLATGADLNVWLGLGLGLAGVGLREATKQIGAATAATGPSAA